jgi:LEA14-like dessication related protein
MSLLVAGLALLAGGCQGAGLFLKQPTATVESVELTKQSEEGGQLTATVKVTNPNDTVLPVPRVSYRVDVEGASPYRFTTVPGVALPGRGTQTFELTAAFERDANPLAGREYRVNGQLSYRPPGEVEAVLFGSGWPLPQAPFQQRGTLK